MRELFIASILAPELNISTIHYYFYHCYDIISQILNHNYIDSENLLFAIL